MRMEEKMFDKELEMQQEARQFQIQMMQMMTSLVHDHSIPSSLPPPITTSTQYPHGSYYNMPYDDNMSYDDDTTQV